MMANTPESFRVQIGDTLVGASHDAMKLPRTLVGSGIAIAGAAVSMALFKKPGGVFLDGKVMLSVYYGTLASIAAFGGIEAAVGFWVSGDPDSLGAKRKAVLWASVVPLVLVAGLGGVAILK